MKTLTIGNVPNTTKGELIALLERQNIEANVPLKTLTELNLDPFFTVLDYDGEIVNLRSEIKLVGDKDVSISSATLRPQDLITAFINYLLPAKHFMTSDQQYWLDRILKEIPVPYYNRGERGYPYVPLSPREERGYPYQWIEWHCDSEDSDWFYSEDCIFILNEDLFSLMVEFCPEGYYFGSHEGDGSDFGYWRIYDDDIAYLGVL